MVAGSRSLVIRGGCGNPQAVACCIKEVVGWRTPRSLQLWRRSPLATNGKTGRWLKGRCAGRARYLQLLRSMVMHRKTKLEQQHARSHTHTHTHTHTPSLSHSHLLSIDTTLALGTAHSLAQHDYSSFNSQNDKLTSLARTRGQQSRRAPVLPPLTCHLVLQAKPTSSTAGNFRSSLGCGSKQSPGSPSERQNELISGQALLSGSLAGPVPFAAPPQPASARPEVPPLLVCARAATGVTWRRPLRLPPSGAVERLLDRRRDGSDLGSELLHMHTCV